MSRLDAPLLRGSGFAAAPSTRPEGTALHVLAAVALGAALAGGTLALTFEHMLVMRQPALPKLQLEPRMPAAPVQDKRPAIPPWPAVHDVLRDGIEPLIEPPPAS